MSNDNNLNDIIKSKFSEQEHPLDEGNWKAMRTMIDESRAKKKRTLWLAGSLVLLLCAIGSIGIYEVNNTGGKASNGNAVSASSNAVSASSQNNQPIATASAQAINSPVKASGSITANSAGNAALEIAKATPANTTAQTTGTNANQPLHKYRNKTQRGVKAGNSAIAITNKDIVKLNKPFAEIGNETNAGNAISSAKEPSAGLLTQAQLPVNATPPLVPKTPAPPASKINTKTPDTATSLPQRFSDEPRIFNGKKQMISIDAGAYYNGGWATSPTTTAGSGFNYIAGVGYAHYLKSKILLKTGIQFSDFGHISSYSYNYQHLSPQNSSIIYDSVITTKRLYYLSIPVQLEKFIGNKCSIGLGGSASYLLTSMASATTYQQLDNNPPTNYQSYSQNIHLNGYNKWTASAFGLFRYAFNRHISAYTMFYFMTPIENRAFFGEKLYLDNVGLKFLLSYTL